MVTRFFGFPGMPDIVRTVLSTHGDIIYPALFLGFFLFGAIAVVKKGKSRQLFVASVLCFLLVSSQMGATMVPFIHAQRYSPVDGQHDDTMAIVLVDSEGNSVDIDERANSPYTASAIVEKMLHEWTDEKRVEIADQILENSEQYRDRVESIFPRVAHPPSSVGTIWSESELESIDDFESVRIYEFNWSYEEGSHKIAEMNQSCLMEVTPESGDVTTECSDD